MTSATWPQAGDRIYHVAIRDEWEDAVRSGGPYRRSTLRRSLEDVGYIHCSFAGQVQGIADLIYAGRSDAMRLEIDPSAVGAEIRVENLEGGTDLFPHIYGPLPLDAVVDVSPMPPQRDLQLPGDVERQ